MMEAEFDAREELATLVAALRTHLEWQVVTGTLGLPRAEPGVSGEAVARDAVPARERVMPVKVELLPGEVPAVGEGPSPALRVAPSVALPVAPSAVTEVAPSSAEIIAPPRRSVRPAPDAMRPELIACGPTPEVQRELEALRLQVLECDRCGLCETRTQTVFARGDASTRLCFVGEGPGGDEDAQGLPFVGAAGQLLDRMIGAMGVSRDEVYVANIVKCRPPKNRKPTPEEMQACRVYLERQLELIEPAVIVALGATAVEGLLEVTGGITKLRGRWKLWRGKVAVMPTFHPAYLLRTPTAKREVWEDLQKVIKHLGRELPART